MCLTPAQIYDGMAPIGSFFVAGARGRAAREGRVPRFPGLFLALAALIAASVSWALPQGPLLDAGTLVIRRSDVVIGREDFTVRRGRSAGPDGYTIASTVTYPPSSPRITLSPVVELGPDSTPVQVQFDVYADGQSRIYARFGPRRITLRVVRPGGESARELPATGREMVVDDSAFALHAVPPARGTRQAVFPRNGERLPVEVVDRGTEQITLQGVPRELRHEVLRFGPQERHLWYDEGGRLMKVEVPALGLVAERGPA